MLEVDNIHVSYDGVPALYGVSFRVEEGEIVSIVGSNGAGKSTVLRTISSLLRPTQGSIRMNGEDLTALRPHDVVLRGIAHVPEGRRLFNRQTIKDNLTLGAFTRRSQADREEVLEQVYEVFPILKKRLGQLAGTLSGGEQQMLAIARALMSRPRLIMMDEPSLGLAPLVIKDIFRIIQEINAKGMTILLIEQNANMALKIADWAYVLETGRITLEGTGSDLLANPEVRDAYLGKKKS